MAAYKIKEHNRRMLKGQSSTLVKAMSESLVINHGLHSLFEKGIKRHSTIIFIDIYNFSNTISYLKTERVKDFIMTYYDTCFKIISEYGGVVEKVMGDGIIAIFSDLFNEMNDHYNANNAINCLLDIINKYFISPEYNSKGAVHFSEPFFCKIGNEMGYKEFTVIGNGLTYCYRLESAIAHSDRIALVDTQRSFFENSRLGEYYSEMNNIQLSGIGKTSVRFYHIESEIEITE